jgi:hypothetical protein
MLEGGFRGLVTMRFFRERFPSVCVPRKSGMKACRVGGQPNEARLFFEEHSSVAKIQTGVPSLKFYKVSYRSCEGSACEQSI